MPTDANIILLGRDLRKTFRRATGEVVAALDGVSIEAHHATLTALVGPDGAGKTTLLRLAAGLMVPDSGELTVLGLDVTEHPQEVQDRIGYMPQKFGLYEDLSVQENLDLYADLHGVGEGQRQAQYHRLMDMTRLGPFLNRLAGKLSGGMKQKPGLACVLVRAPELPLLDEPTVGVDPLSRRELWEIILQLVNEQGLTVLLSTSYLDEAERCGHVLVMHSGKALAQGHPAEIAAIARNRSFIAEPPADRTSEAPPGAERAGESASCVKNTSRGLQARLLDDPDVADAVPEAGRVRFVRADGAAAGHTNGGLLAGARVSPAEPRFEDGFMLLLTRNVRGEHVAAMKLVRPQDQERAEVVVEVRELVRQFGSFIAVDHISFEVRSGEIFGLLGPNGAGKTTTFRMLCGLLQATSGTLTGADSPVPAFPWHPGRGYRSAVPRMEWCAHYNPSVQSQRRLRLLPAR
jgi:ABC-2 type transport system ATP-binding protein